MIRGSWGSNAPCCNRHGPLPQQANLYLYHMKTYAVRAKTNKAEALISQLVDLGVIEAEELKKPHTHLADVMLAIRSQVKDKLTVQEVLEEVDAVRAKRYAASKKA